MQALWSKHLIAGFLHVGLSDPHPFVRPAQLAVVAHPVLDRPGPVGGFRAAVHAGAEQARAGPLQRPGLRGADARVRAAAAAQHGRGEVAGSWMKQGSRYTISSRGYAGPDGGELPKRIRVTVGSDEVQSVQDAASGKPIALTHLDPARIATLYGATQEERRFVQLADVPPLLLSGLQAVEDRNFKH